MKQLKIQSISDIITNSSSEVFVCTCKGNPVKIAEEIREFIDNLMEILGYSNDDYYVGANVNIAKSDGCISGWDYTYNQNDILIESVYDNSIPYNIMQILEDLEFIPVFENKITNVSRHHLG